MAKKKYLTDFKATIKKLSKTSEKIKNSEFKILDFQSLIDNPADRLKAEFLLKTNKQFDELINKTRRYNNKMFDKFIECSKALSTIPDITIDETKINADDTRIPSDVTIYTQFFQVCADIPVQGVLSYRASAKLIQSVNDEHKIILHVCLGEEFPVWTDFFIEFCASTSIDNLAEKYEAEMQKALKILSKKEAEKNKG